MAVLFSSTFTSVVDGVVAEVRGRVLVISCTIRGQMATVASIYAPNSAQEGFLTQAITQVLSARDGEVVCGWGL